MSNYQVSIKEIRFKFIDGFTVCTVYAKAVGVPPQGFKTKYTKTFPAEKVILEIFRDHIPNFLKWNINEELPN